MGEINIQLKNAFADLQWLKRYSEFKDIGFTQTVNVDTKIKSLFSAAAWRLVCRSDSSAFFPFRRSLRFGLDDLVAYAETLCQHGFRVAPPARVLHAFGFSDVAAEIWKNGFMSSQAFYAMRLATGHGNFCRKELHAVLIYLHQGHKINKGVTWATLLERVHAWKNRQQVVESRKKWDFACFATNWDIYQIVPLVSPVDLWDEGQAMSNCLYSLRSQCDSDKATRFFSLRLGGKRHATFSLSCLVSQQVQGSNCKYQIDDCRQKANRVPHKQLIDSIWKFSEHYQSLVQQERFLAFPVPVAAWRCEVNWGGLPKK